MTTDSEAVRAAERRVYEARAALTRAQQANDEAEIAYDDALRALEAAELSGSDAGGEGRDAG